MVKVVNWDVVMGEVPDEIALALNLSNCPFHCDGCHSPELREDIGQLLDTRLLEELIKSNKGITCIALLGGDSDKDYVLSLCDYIRMKYRLKTCWYSGDTEEFTRSDKYWHRIMSSLNYIKVGPYIKELGPLTSKTTNQRFYKIDTLNTKFIDLTYRFWK